MWPKKFIHRIVILFLMLALFFILLASSLGYLNSLSQLKREVKDNASRMLNYIGRSFSDVITTVNYNAMTLFSDSSDDVQALLNGSFASEIDRITCVSRVQKRLSDFVSLNNGVESAELYFEVNETVVSSDNAWRIIPSVERNSYEQYFEMAMAYRVEEAAYIRIIPYGQPGLRGVAVIRLDTRWFSELIESYMPVEQFVILGEQGRTIFGKTIPKLDSARISGKQGSFKMLYEGEHCTVFYTEPDSNGRTCISIIKDSYIYGSSKFLLATVITLTFLILLLMTIVFLEVKKRLLKPFDSIEDEFREAGNVLRQYRMAALLNGESIDSGRKRILDMSLYSDNFVVILVRAEGVTDEIVNHINGIIAEHTKGIAAISSKGVMSCILSFQNGTLNDSGELSRVIAEYIRTLLVFEYNLNLVIGIGGCVAKQENIPKSYNQANNALLYCEARNNNPITVFDDIKNEITGAVNSDGEIPKAGLEIVEAVEEYISVNFENSDLSLSSVAEKFNISVSYLSRLIKQHTGKTFLEHLITLRMEMAKRLLIETDMKVDFVVDKVGYQNYNSFAKTFKKYTGLSANEYRQNGE